MELLPHAGVRPRHQAAPAGAAGAAPHLLGEHLPWDSGAQDVKDARQYGAVGNRPTPMAMAAAIAAFGNQGCDAAPTDRRPSSCRAMADRTKRPDQVQEAGLRVLKSALSRHAGQGRRDV